MKAAHLAVKLIETADPGEKAVLEITSEADVESLSYSELVAFAQANGITPATPPEALPGPE